MANITTDEVQRINLKGIAVPNQKYTDVEGNVYMGTAQGRLRFIDQLHGDVTGPQIETVVENIGRFTVTEVVEILENVEDLPTPVEEYNAEQQMISDLESFSIAMAITL